MSGGATRPQIIGMSSLFGFTFHVCTISHRFFITESAFSLLIITVLGIELLKLGVPPIKTCPLPTAACVGDKILSIRLHPLLNKTDLWVTSRGPHGQRNLEEDGVDQYRSEHRECEII